jgi:hypothetical protein
VYLIFPESVIIPEVAERQDDAYFEDWLTVALIENTNQPDMANGSASSPGVIDLWMLEITERSAGLLTGHFQVEFNKENAEIPTNAKILEDGTGLVSFLLDTNTGEMRLTSAKPAVSRSRGNRCEGTEMWAAAA